MLKAVIGLIFFMDATGQLVAPPLITSYDTTLQCSDHISSIKEELETEAQRDISYQGYQIKGICIESEELS